MIEKDCSVIRCLRIIDNITGLVLLEPANERIELWIGQNLITKLVIILSYN